MKYCIFIMENREVVMEKYNYEGEKFLSKLYSDIHMKQSVIHSSNVSDKKYEKIRKYGGEDGTEHVRYRHSSLPS